MYIYTVVFLMLLLIAFSVILVYASAITTLRIQRENTKIVLDNFIEENSIVIYRRLIMRQTAVNDSLLANFTSALQNYCSLSYGGGKYYKYDGDGAVVFSIENLTVDSEATETAINFTARFTVKIPMRFAGQTVSTVTVPMRVKSEFQLNAGPAETTGAIETTE